MGTFALQELYRSALVVCQIGPWALPQREADCALDGAHYLELLLVRRYAIYVINEAQCS
jgi:hypothetical protein